MYDDKNIVSAEWLKALIDDSNLKIFDATFHIPATGRDAIAEFDEEHISGAQRFDLGVIADPDATLPHTVPSAGVFQMHMQALGVNQKDHVIVYDDSVFMSSARAWWLLRMFGHERVFVLDGGLKRFIAVGGKTESGAGQPLSKSDFKASKPQGLPPAYVNGWLFSNAPLFSNQLA